MPCDWSADHVRVKLVGSELDRSASHTGLDCCNLHPAELLARKHMIKCNLRSCPGLRLANNKTISKGRPGMNHGL